MIASYQHVQHTLDRERLSTFRHYSLGYFVVRFRFPSLGPWGLKSSFSCQWSALYRELVQRISCRFSLHKVMCVYVFSPSWTIRDDESLSTNTWYERLMSFQWWFALHSTPLWNDICSGSMTTMHYSIYLKWNLRYTKVLRYWCHKPFPGLHDIKQILGNVPMALASLNLYSGLIFCGDMLDCTVCLASWLLLCCRVEVYFKVYLDLGWISFVVTKVHWLVSQMRFDVAGQNLRNSGIPSGEGLHSWCM